MQKLEWRKFSAIFFLVGTSATFANGTEKIDQFIGNVPTCDALSKRRVANTLSAEQLANKAASLYCDQNDAIRAKERPWTKLLAAKANHYVDVDGAFWSISDRTFVNELCRLVSSEARHVRLVGGVDKSAPALEEFNDCVKKLGIKGLRNAMAFSLPLELKSFHPKFLLLTKEDRTGELFIGSGNPTISSAVNIDFYLSMSLGANGLLSNWHQCVSDVIDPIDPYSSSEELERAVGSCDLAGLSFGRLETKPYLMPFNKEVLLTDFSFWAGKSKEIKVISQGYDSPEVLGILINAASYGAKVSMIRDDDLLLTHSSHPNLTNEAAEYYAWDRWLCKAGAQVKYLLTNPGFNYLHAKFVVFEGDFGSVVFFGSPNLSYSFTRFNIENVYISTHAGISNAFRLFFNDLWLNYSLTQREVDDRYKKIGPLINIKRMKNNVCS